MAAQHRPETQQRVNARIAPFSERRPADRPAVIHHHRRDGDGIETRLAAEGRIALDPPGIGIAIEDFYAR